MLVPLSPRRAFTELPIESLRERDRRRVPFDRRIDARPEATPRREHTSHLLERSRPIREELQAELAEDHVELASRERKRKHAPLSPLQLRQALTRDPQHLEVHVHPDHPSPLA